MKRTQYSTPQPAQEALTSMERAARIVIGIALMSSVFVAEGALNWAVVLPLVAVYPLLTGVMGQEPLRNFFDHGSIAYRGAQFAIGGALVGSVFAIGQFSAVPLGEFMILPLVGIYYVLAGIIGRAPLATFEEAMHEDTGRSAIPAVATSRITSHTREGYPRAA